MKQTNQILIFLASILIMGCSTMKCIDFHEGKFQIGDGYVIERKGGVQIEHNLNESRET